MKKILISCNCNGNVEFVIQKAAILSQKTAFDFLIMAGNVFTPSSSTYIHKIIQKQVMLPFPVYFIDNSQIGQIMASLFPNGHQICPNQSKLQQNKNNMYFLGKYGIKQTQGLSIAYLNDQQCVDNPYSYIESVNSLRQLIKECKQPIDILLTHDQPCQIALLSPNAIVRSSAYLSQLILECAPKYHIAAGRKQFYRMDAYRNSKGSVTHFINIAQIQSIPPKDKYLYAIQTIPLKHNPTQQETNSNILPNPFNAQKEKQKQAIKVREQLKSGRYLSKEERMGKQGTKKQQDQTITKETYIYFEGFPASARQSDITEFMERWGDILTIQTFKGKGSGLIHYRSVDSTADCLRDSNKVTFQNSRIKFKIRQIYNRHRDTQCWFCISEPHFNHDLLLHKAKHCYIAMEKGPLTPNHLQIIPYNHVDRLSRLQSVERDQINDIIAKLTQYYTSINQCPIVYERCIRLSSQISHCIIHVLSLPHLQQPFSTINKSDQLGFKRITTDQQQIQQHYIRLQVGADNYIREIYRKEKLPIDYVRKIVAELIGNPRIVNWKDCIRNEQQFNTDKSECMGILAKLNI